jgi:hypothetical protein
MVKKVFDEYRRDAIHKLETHCHEIVMVVRSKRIISKQNRSNQPICNPLKRGVE